MTRKLHIRLFAIAVLALGVVGLASCGDDDDHMAGPSGGMTAANAPAGSIAVDLSNWAIVPAQKTARAGEVRFYAIHSMQHMHGTNEGGNTHELGISRKNADGTYDLVGKVQDIKMGEAKELAVTLTPGDYELQCSVVEEIGGKVISHYKEGMRANFTVTQ